LLQWILLGKTRDDGLMNLKSDLFLYLSANWLDDFFGESFEDLLLVVVNNIIRLLSVLYIPEHL